MSNSVQLVILIGFAAIVAGVVSVGFAYEDFAGLIIVGLGILILAIILIPRLLPKRDRRFLLNLAILGFIAKIAGSLSKLGITEGIWGFSDAQRYHNAGTQISAAIRDLDISASLALVDSGTTAGTRFTEYLQNISPGLFMRGWDQPSTAGTWCSLSWRS